MLRNFNTAFTALILLFVLALAAQAEQPDVNAENTEQVIAHLVEELGRSHLIFIRNGVKYSSDEAVKHILKKYHYFKSQIEEWPIKFQYSFSKLFNLELLSWNKIIFCKTDESHTEN